jgi:glycine/D-amino acid oxidase-like deaminating enzyme
MPSFPRLSATSQADACVVGGGIAGLTTAYLLAQAGKQVVLLEAFELLAGETGRTTAHWAPPDERYCQIEESFGAEGASKVARSFRAATDLAESIVRTQGIHCGFERLDGYLYCLPGQDREVLEQELAAARRAGVEVERLEHVAGIPFDSGPCLRFASQAQLHPVMYLASVARA